MGRRTRIHEGNYCTEGYGSLVVCRMDVNGFSYNYKKDEFIYGVNYKGERWITTRHNCSLITENPAVFIRSHCCTGQAQEIIKSYIWPEVARDLILIASQSPGDAFNLGFKEGLNVELLEVDEDKLPTYIGNKDLDDVGRRIIEVRLTEMGDNRLPLYEGYKEKREKKIHIDVNGIERKTTINVQHGRISFQCTSELYEITDAGGMAKDALTQGFVPLGDGCDYTLNTIEKYRIKKLIAKEECYV